MFAELILRLLRLRVAAGEMAQRTYGRIGEILRGETVAVEHAEHGGNAAQLVHNQLVALVVAGEIRENARHANDNVDVVAVQQLHQGLDGERER